MRLLIIRHGVAEDRAPGVPDESRALTPDGRRRMKRAATALRDAVERPDVIATSPLVRARETAEIVARALGGAEMVAVPALEPGGDPRDVADWLASRTDDELVAVVGHEPCLGRLATWLLCGRDAQRVEVKKGAALMLEVAGPPRAGSARLIFLLQPGHLRRMR